MDSTEDPVGPPEESAGDLPSAPRARRGLPPYGEASSEDLGEAGAAGPSAKFRFSRDRSFWIPPTQPQQRSEELPSLGLRMASPPEETSGPKEADSVSAVPDPEAKEAISPAKSAGREDGQPKPPPEYRVLRPLSPEREGLWLLEREEDRSLFVLKACAQEEERLLAQQLEHPCLLPCTESTSSGLVFEYALGGSAEQRARAVPMTEAETVFMCRRVLEALEYLHEQDIEHGDVHPGNVLFDAEGRALLADLGNSRAWGQTREEVWGAPGFSSLLSEELGNRGRARTGPSGESEPGEEAADDLFGLAATAWFCLSGCPPEPEASRGVLDAETPLSESFALLLESALSTDRSERPSLAEWKRTLNRLGPGEPLAHVGSHEPEALGELRTQSLGQLLRYREDPPGRKKPRTSPRWSARSGSSGADQTAREWRRPAAALVVAVLLCAGAGWWLTNGSGTGDESASAAVQKSTPSAKSGTSGTAEAAVRGSSGKASTNPQPKRPQQGAETITGALAQAIKDLRSLLLLRVAALAAGNDEDLLAVSRPGSPAHSHDRNLAQALTGGMKGLKAEVSLGGVRVSGTQVSAVAVIRYSEHTQNGKAAPPVTERVRVRAQYISEQGRRTLKFVSSEPLGKQPS